MLPPQAHAATTYESQNTILLKNYARKILNTHYPVYIDEKTDQKIRDKFPIKISKDIIKPNSNRF